MISVDNAKKIINENLPGLKFKEIGYTNALGLVLSEDIYSNVNMPGFTNSAMDGFAVKWEDVKEISERVIKLKIIGESAAGIPFKGTSEMKTAVRINTGALLPEEFDTVVPIENVAVENDFIVIKSVKKKYQNVRYAGEEFKIGDLLLSKNTVVNPPEIALLASSGVEKVKVYEPLKVTIIITGTELISGGTEINESQIRESNSIMLSSLFNDAGSNVEKIIKIGDSLNDTILAIKEAESISDIIILSGGVSVGPHDHVKEASEKNGFKELFWKVNQKPGKPLFFAKKEKTILFGLPGNPVSALMCALYYIYPILIELSGKKTNNNFIKAISKKNIMNKQDRAHFMRAKIINDGENIIEIDVLEKQASHMLSTLTEADGFVLLEPSQEIKPNELINYYPFPWRRRWAI